MRIPAVVVWLALGGVSLAAQQPKWNLPPGGLAVYDAEEAFEPEPHGGILPGCPLPHATILLQSELAAAGTHVDGEAQDWRWIAPHLAFDLRLPTAGRVTTRLQRVGGLGDVECSGTAATKDGTTTYDLTLKIATPVLTSDEKRLLGNDKKAWYGGEGGGALKLERTVDPAAGVVQTFHATTTLAVTCGPYHDSAAVRGTFTQHWELDEVLGNRTPGFQARVAQAILDGADVVEHALRLDHPAFATIDHPDDHPCGEGKIALAIQTLLAAGRPADAPVIREAFAELHKRDIKETYSLSVALLATELAHAPPLERDNLLRSVITTPTPRQLAPAETAKVAEWTQRLLQNRDQSVDAAYRSRWWYLRGSGFDNSNTQYALLGLYSALLCQQPISRGVWLASGEHLLQAQHPASGKSRPLRLVPLASMQDKDLASLLRSGSQRTVAPRGFSYRLPGEGPAYGSMTCAGIAGLSLCRGALETEKERDKSLDGKLDEGIRQGFAWLSANRTVRWNAGAPPNRNTWFFYWLYSLERACELSRVGLIDDWDWYHDGAQVLLALQDRNGKFGRASLEDQCFAVLFLKKAQLPVLTGPR